MTGKTMILTLPWPPSVNSYWRHPTSGKLAGRHIISQEGREYQKAVKWIVSGVGVRPLEGSVSVSILAYPPDRRRRDIDNILKSLLDAMTHAGVWLDDSQIDELHITRMSVGNRVEVAITGSSSMA